LQRGKLLAIRRTADIEWDSIHVIVIVIVVIAVARCLLRRKRHTVNIRIIARVIPKHGAGWTHVNLAEAPLGTTAASALPAANLQARRRKGQVQTVQFALYTHAQMLVQAKVDRNPS
jgi:hypothetical protein